MLIDFRSDQNAGGFITRRNGNQFRRHFGPYGRAADNNVRQKAPLFESLSCQGGIPFAAVVEWPCNVGLVQVQPAGFRVAYDDEMFDLESPAILALGPVFGAPVWEKFSMLQPFVPRYTYGSKLRVRYCSPRLHLA